MEGAEPGPSYMGEARLIKLQRRFEEGMAVDILYKL